MLVFFSSFLVFRDNINNRNGTENTYQLVHGINEKEMLSEADGMQLIVCIWDYY
jgi:hypothetical protein